MCHVCKLLKRIIVLIITIIIIVTLINSDPCPTMSWWVLEFLGNYAWKVLENSFSIIVTNCVGAQHAVIRTRCTPWGFLKITWHTTFPVKPHKICDRAFNYVLGGGNASVYLEGLKIPVVIFVIVCCCFPLLNKNATLFWPLVFMVLLDLTAIFQNWKGRGGIISLKRVASDSILRSNRKAAAAVSKGEQSKKSGLK